MKIKKVMSFVLSVSLILGMSVSVSAAETMPVASENATTASVYLSANDKMTFADRMDSVYQEAVLTGEIKAGNREKIDALMEQATFATGSKKEDIRQELAEYGVYMYDSSVQIQPYSGSGDVSMSTPTVFYESWEKTWTVTCGGNWKNNKWIEQMFVGDIGGADAFGVGYTNSSNSYKSSVVRASAYITDEKNNKKVSTSNRSDGDGSKGFGFRLQDYMYNTLVDTQYVGYKWYGSCTYDSDFGTYNGVATAYYVHTYDNTKIDSISFGLQGKTAGVDVSFSSGAKSFIAYSNDKTFGVY